MYIAPVVWIVVQRSIRDGDTGNELYDGSFDDLSLL